MEKMNQKNYNLNSKIEDIPILPKAKKILLSNNFFKVEDIINHTKKDIKSIKGMGGLNISSLELFLKEYKLKFKKVEKAPDEFINLKRKLILKLLKNTENINWANEIKAASTLLKNYPSPEFWDNFTLPFKLNSLYFLLSEKGRQFIYAAKQKKMEIKTFIKEEISLEERKVGEDIITHKPKSIKDFLNE